MRRFASFFGEVLLYQHQRIVIMTKVYIKDTMVCMVIYPNTQYLLKGQKQIDTGETLDEQAI